MTKSDLVFIAALVAWGLAFALLIAACGGPQHPRCAANRTPGGEGCTERQR